MTTYTFTILEKQLTVPCQILESLGDKTLVALPLVPGVINAECVEYVDTKSLSEV